MSSFCLKYLTFAAIYLEELRFLNNIELTFKQLKIDYLNWSLQNQTGPLPFLIVFLLQM